MRSRLSAVCLLLGAFLSSVVSVAGEDQGARVATRPTRSRPEIRVGAVASTPSSVTVFESLRRYLGRRGLTIDYVLYSNYDALVDALAKNHVDIAWNTPLAHAQYHRRAGNGSWTLVMRNVDKGFRSVLVVKTDAAIQTVDDLKGKTLILGSQEAAEATILPLYFLKHEGVDQAELKILSLDRELDLRGNPCSSEHHVLKALQEGRGLAGVIGKQLWDRLSKEQPDQVNGLRCLWVSPPFSHCVFTASKDFDSTLGSRFTALMLAMTPADSDAAEVLRLEGARQWVAGSNEGFQDLLKALSECDAACCAETP